MGGSAPRDTDQSLENNGFNSNQGTCSPVDVGGIDNGQPIALLNNVDWNTVFVGHYNAGDMQHRGHVSYNNNNLIYWKETKNFADGCSAHISEGYYAHGTMALPDQSTFIIERTTFDAWVVLEANHHCNVGVTGMLCMPQYIFHDVDWKVTKGGAWIWPQRGRTGGGGVFSLSPPNAAQVMTGAPLPHSIFPIGYVSLASSHYTYLTSTEFCTPSDDMGLGSRYSGGILCKSPLRAVKVWSTNFQKSTAPSLKVEMWLGTDQSVPPDASQMVNFHQIADLGGGKQGYSLPVLILEDVSYRLSLGDDAGGDIPKSWIIEFSDTVMGNRWEAETLNLTVQGRNCENGTVSSQHSRRHMYGLGFEGSAFGSSGACVDSNPPNMPAIDCNAALTTFSDKAGAAPSSECPELCTPRCNSDSYCHCGTSTCTEKPGIDVCNQARCGEHGTCSARYLGDSSSLPVANKACICESGWSGEVCDQRKPVNIARSLNSVIQ